LEGAVQNERKKAAAARPLVSTTSGLIDAENTRPRDSDAKQSTRADSCVPWSQWVFSTRVPAEHTVSSKLEKRLSSRSCPSSSSTLSTMARRHSTEYLMRKLTDRSSCGEGILSKASNSSDSICIRSARQRTVLRDTILRKDSNTEAATPRSVSAIRTGSAALPDREDTESMKLRTRPNKYPLAISLSSIMCAAAPHTSSKDEMWTKAASHRHTFS